MRTLLRSLAVVSVLCFSMMGLCQDSRGMKPFGSYSGDGIFKIDLNTRMLSGLIPLASYDQLGKLPPIKYYIRISTPVYYYNEDCYPASYICFLSYRPTGHGNLNGVHLASTVGQANSLWVETMNWHGAYADPTKYGPFAANNYYYQPHAITDPEGQAHELLYSKKDFTRLYSTDGSGYVVKYPDGSKPYDVLTSQNTADAVITDSNGISYRLDNGFPLIEDHQGNSIRVSSQINEVYGHDVIDSVGRVLPYVDDPRWYYLPEMMPLKRVDSSICPDLGVSSQKPDQALELSFPGVNGKQSQVIACYTTVYIHTGFHLFDATLLENPDATWAGPPIETPTPDEPVRYRMSEYVSTFPALQSVLLPTGKYWGFIYDSSVPFEKEGKPASTEAYGGITKILYPDGASVSFPSNNHSLGYGSYPCGDQNKVSYIPIIDGDVVYDDGLGHSWKETYTNDGVTDAAGNVTVHHFSNLALNDKLLVCSTSGQDYETETDYYAGKASGTPIKKVLTEYQYQSLFHIVPGTGGVTNILPKKITTIVGGKTQSVKQYSYPKVVDLDDIGCAFSAGHWGCGTAEDFWDPVTNLPISSPNYYTEDIYDGDNTLLSRRFQTFKYQTNNDAFGSNLLNLIESEGIGDATNDKLAYSTYEYDSAGNQTSASRWVLGDQHFALTSKSTFNKNGTLESSTDPRGVKTSITYECSGLYPSTTTHADGTSISQKETITHDCATGLVTEKKNANDVAANRKGTRFDYTDTAYLKSVTYPDGGQVTYDYNKFSNPPQITTTVSASPSPDIVTRALYDGFNRKVQEQLAPDTANTVFSSTLQYDGLGNISRQWNASECNPLDSSSCTGKNTPGSITFEYDALGRLKTKTYQDGASEKWEYSGLDVDYWDAGLKHWTRKYNALGQLSNVIEDADHSKYETKYKYDGLGNLQTVTQKGDGSNTLTRSFTYDSLSRLITSYNPEIGTICYGIKDGDKCVDGYDDNGNLQKKTDPRNTVVNYSYDELNRILSKSYPDDSHSTPSSCYQYDTATNGIGKLAVQWTQKGTCPKTPSGVVLTKLAISSYDNMGRILSAQQCVFSICSKDYPDNATYSYDLAGNIKTFSDGIGKTLFTNEYDFAGRLLKLTSSWSGTNQPSTLFSSPSYNANGSITKALYGANLWITRTYDSRLRLVGESDTVTDTPVTGVSP